MADNNPSAGNLDLNLGPLDNSGGEGEPGLGTFPDVALNLEDWLDDPISSEDWLGDPVVRVRDVFRQRSQRWRSLLREVPIPLETRNLALELSGVNEPSGEGSATAEEIPPEMIKMCENTDGFLGNEVPGKKEDAGKSNGEEGSFFDCNICLDLAKDPVVTCCGHLFCWPCLYQWLNHHSDAKECPVCKGEVTMKNVTPIYGRGNNVPESSSDSSLKVPLRPQARRIESWRQTIQRTAFTIPMEEMIRRLGSTFDLNRELSQIQFRNSEARQNSPERGSSFLNRILTSRGMRRERTPAPAPAPVLPSDDIIDLTESSPSNYEARDAPRLSPLLLHRANSHRAGSLSGFQPVMGSAASLAAERLVESYFHDNPVDRNQDVPLRADDRDSISSIAAVIHSESQTLDNVIEIDSRVSLSTSSSRRRNEPSRTSDVDSGDSRAPRRRRLQLYTSD